MNEEFTPSEEIEQEQPSERTWEAPQEEQAQAEQPQEVQAEQAPEQEKTAEQAQPPVKKNKILSATSIVCFAVAALMVFCVLYAIVSLWPEYQKFGENLEGSEGVSHGLGGAIIVLFYLLSFILFGGVMIENVVYGIIYAVCYGKNVTPRRQALGGAFLCILEVVCALTLVFIGSLWEGHPVIPYYIVAAIVLGGGVLRIVTAVICLQKAKLYNV